MPLIRRTFPVGALGCNCSIIACPDTRQALVIDPGDDAADILADLARDGLTAVSLLHTHAHFDHVMGTADVAAATGAEVLVHRDDRWLYDRTLMQIDMFGVRRADGQPWHPPPPPTRELTGDEVVTFGRREAHVLHTPGHTPGSTCFFVEAVECRETGRKARSEEPLLLAGDTLFAGSSAGPTCGAGRCPPSEIPFASACSHCPTTRWSFLATGPRRQSPQSVSRTPS